MRGSDDKTGSLHISLQSYCSMRHGSKGFLAGITTVTQQSGPFPLRLLGGEVSPPEENMCFFKQVHVGANKVWLLAQWEFSVKLTNHMVDNNTTHLYTEPATHSWKHSQPWRTKLTQQHQQTLRTFFFLHNHSIFLRFGLNRGTPPPFSLYLTGAYKYKHTWNLSTFAYFCKNMSEQDLCLSFQTRHCTKAMHKLTHTHKHLPLALRGEVSAAGLVGTPGRPLPAFTKTTKLIKEASIFKKQ